MLRPAPASMSSIDAFALPSARTRLLAAIDIAKKKPAATMPVYCVANGVIASLAPKNTRIGRMKMNRAAISTVVTRMTAVYAVPMAAAASSGLRHRGDNHLDGKYD